MRGWGEVPAWTATWEQAANQCCDPRALLANGVRRSLEGGAGGGASLLVQGSRLAGGRPAPPRRDWLLWAGLAPVMHPARVVSLACFPAAGEGPVPQELEARIPGRS